MRWTTLALLLFSPALAHADGSVALRVTDSGLQWLADRAMAQVPEELELETITFPLADCWPSDSSIRIYDGHLSVSDLAVSFPLDSEDLGIELDASARVSGTVLLDAIGCLPLSVSCDVTIDVDDAHMAGSLELGSGSDGELVGGLGPITVDLGPQNLDVEFNNCTGDIDDRLDSIYEQAEADLLRLMQLQLVDFVDTRIRPEFDAVFGSALTVPLDSADLDATIRIQDAEVRSEALEIRASVGLVPRAIDACIPAPGDAAPGGEDAVEFSRWDPTPFALGISERLANEAMSASWQAGKLCFDPKDLSGLGGVVAGIPDGVDMQLTFQLDEAPAIDFQPDGAHIALNQVTARIHYTSPGGEGDAVFTGSGGARALLELDPASNGLHLSTFDLAIVEMALVSGGLPEGADLGAIMEGLVFPTMLELVGDVRIADGVLPVSGYWVIVNSVDFFDASVSLAFELFATPEEDEGDPDTEILEAPTDPVAKAEEVTIRVGGTDDLVPERLLQFQIRDGEDGEFTEATFSPTFRVRKYQPGEYSFEVRAVDLAGNVDPEPAKFILEVADVLPESSGHPDTLPPPDHRDDTDDPILTGGEGAGCGCRTSGETAPRGWTALLSLLAVVAVLHRRR